jgi:DNA-binding IclR family transcriptional regulator
VAYSREKRTPHVNCVATPITTDNDDEVLGTVGAICPANQTKDARLKSELADKV